MNDAQVEDKHRYDEHIEENPSQGIAHGYCGLEMKLSGAATTAKILFRG
jgi:hypothetical protein